MSPRARRTLAIYLILVKWDYTGIAAPMGAIADAIKRATFGEGGSIRTLQRANKELSERGFIEIPQFRPGVHSKHAVIRFNLDAFSYWTGKKSKSVSPMPTQSHNVVSRETMCDTVAHTTTCRPSDRTRDNSCSNSQDLPKNINTKQRAGARAKFKISRKNALIYTVSRVVLPQMQNLHRTERKEARSRMECEIKAIAAGIEILNPSGVDWEYWEKRWEEMTISARESTARREIIPALIPRLQKKAPKPEMAAAYPVTVSGPSVEVDPVTPEQIREFTQQLIKSFEIPKPETKISDKTDEQPNSLERDELAVLMAAKARCQSRGSR